MYILIFIFIYSLIEETEISSGSLHIFLNLVPEVLIFKELVPLTVMTDT
jgi:hypothetical protein